MNVSIITVGTVSYKSFEMLSSYFISKSEICTQCPFVFFFVHLLLHCLMVAYLHLSSFLVEQSWALRNSLVSFNHLQRYKWTQFILNRWQRSLGHCIRQTWCGVVHVQKTRGIRTDFRLLPVSRSRVVVRCFGQLHDNRSSLGLTAIMVWVSHISCWEFD